MLKQILKQPYVLLSKIKGSLVPSGSLFLDQADSKLKAKKADGTTAVLMEPNPEKKNAAASALDDGFDDDELDAKWTLVNGGVGTSSLVSLETNNPKSKLAMVTTPFDGKVTAILQSLPSGDFTVITRLRSNGFASVDVDFGLIMTDGVTVGSGKQLMVCTTLHGDYFFCLEQINFDRTQNITGFGLDTANPGPIQYLRLRRASGVLKVAASVTGEDGSWLEETIAPTLTPTHIGLMGWAQNAGNHLGLFDFFYYFPNANGSIGES
jgi:hypothetical protein